MGLIWGRQDPVGPHVGPMNFAIWDAANWPYDMRYVESRIDSYRNIVLI